MKQVTAFLTIAALTFGFISRAQNSSPFWSLSGNSSSTATADSKLGTTESIPLNFITNNQTRMYIDPDGRVGIGLTTTPATLFQVNGFGGFGNRVTTANAIRALNLADVDAVMRILRVHATNAPAVELISRTSADGPNVAYWDFYAEPGDKSFRIRDRVGGGSGLDRLTVASPSGFVGINTNTPLTRFHVNGFGAFGNQVTTGNAIRALNLIDNNAVMRVLRVHSSFAPAVELISRTSAEGADVAYWDFYAEPSDKSFRIRDRVGGGSGLDRVTVNGAGNLGIGTNTPLERLHVEGNQRLAGNLTFTSGSQSIQFANPGSTPAPMMYMFSSGFLNSNRMVLGHSPAYPDWGLRYNDVIDRFEFLGDGDSKLSVNLQNGNVGVGVLNAATRMDILGGNWNVATTEGDFRIGSATHRLKIGVATGGDGAGDARIRPVGGTSRLMLGANDALVVNGSGNVGVGTIDPTVKLDVSRTDGQFLIAKFRNNAASGDRTALIDIQNGNTSPVLWRYGVGGTGNGLGLTTGQFYIERAGLGAVMTMASNGNVGIGTINPTYKLAVNGTIRAKEIRVESGWADYVFEQGYRLRPLSEVENFIAQNKHLPGIPSAKEIQEDGLAVGEVQTKMMEKIEELTLYIIELQKEINQLKKQQKKSH